MQTAILLIIPFMIWAFIGLIAAIHSEGGFFLSLGARRVSGRLSWLGESADGAAWEETRLLFILRAFCPYWGGLALSFIIGKLTEIINALLLGIVSEIGRAWCGERK